MKSAIATWVPLAVLAGALAAPGPKDKPEKLPPPTDEQFSLAEQNLKQIGLAMHNYESVFGKMPGNELSKDGKPLLSWRVQILPYIEEDTLFRKFKMNEPWDSDHNKTLIDRMPKLYASVRGKLDPGLTYYQSFAGKLGYLSPGGRNFATITDGTSNTLMVAEAAKPVVWTRPDDIEFDGKAVPKLGGMFDGDFHAVLCDGSVRRFPKKLDPDVLKAIITVAGEEVVELDAAIEKATKKE